MIRDLIIEYVPVIILFLFTLYLLVKVVAMQRINSNSSFTPVFIRSFLLFSEQEIRNTFHKKLESYLVFSNKLNRVYYALLGLFGGVYLLMYLM